jgi:allantoin racemase
LIIHKWSNLDPEFSKVVKSAIRERGVNHMKIWYQSTLSIDKDPMFNDYKISLMSHLNRVARPGTEVTVHGTEITSPFLEWSMYEELLHDRQIIDNLIQAEKEGYDAFCVGCMFDPAFYALREVGKIPVCSLAEATMLLACLLSPNFSLLASSKEQLRKETELVKRYALQDRFIKCEPMRINLEELQKGFQDPRIVMESAKEVAREAAKKGVCILVNGCGCTNMVLAKHGIREIEGIPVMEGGGALIKIAEMLVDLKNMGINRSHLGPYTSMAKGDLSSLRKMYGLE